MVKSAQFYSQETPHCFPVAFLWFLFLWWYSQRLDNYSFFQHSICWQYSTGPVFLCAKTGVVSVVKAKSMNRSQCLDVYLKLVLGETLWNSGPQDSLTLSSIKQCSLDSAPRECFCVLCQALVTIPGTKVTHGFVVGAAALNVGHLLHSRTAPPPGPALSPSRGQSGERCRAGPRLPPGGGRGCGIRPDTAHRPGRRGTAPGHTPPASSVTYNGFKLLWHKLTADSHGRRISLALLLWICKTCPLVVSILGTTYLFPMHWVIA